MSSTMIRCSLLLPLTLLQFGCFYTPTPTGEQDVAKDLVVETRNGRWMCRVRITRYLGGNKAPYRHPLVIYSDELAHGEFPDYSIGSRGGVPYDTLLGEPLDMVEGSVVYCDLNLRTHSQIPKVEWPLDMFDDEEAKRGFLTKLIEENPIFKNK